ncbi:uncharacterized protein CDV56_101652 [Aspergillus thermomutatus]|uniref:Uncharacterized protein n=1 Tax=Aspergillus thermomutatus TaxID=41047 RepID=A0A397GIV3_ASPTH|nr:uncharacterized protein CDV56_101652 [Aspergillus thermomutatus]RHZ50902.1 hypothetical protein CDV56_101652 [Aspergillus thermomutatus]
MNRRTRRSMGLQLAPDSSSLPDANGSSAANVPLTKSRDHAHVSSPLSVVLHAPSLLSPPATSSQSRRNAPQRESRGTCSCLPTAVFLLHELEASSGNSQERHLDSQLSSYRETLSWCERMLQCSTCRSRPENMTVLNLVLERLVGLCDSIVGAYFDVIDSSGNSSSNSNSSNATEHHPWSTSKSRATEWPEMVLDDYDIAGPDWKTLVRVLIFIQMGALDSLLTRMKRIPSMAQQDSQMVRLLRSEQRNARIARRLWPGLLETTPLSESGPYMILGLRSI